VLQVVKTKRAAAVSSVLRAGSFSGDLIAGAALGGRGRGRPPRRVGGRGPPRVLAAPPFGCCRRGRLRLGCSVQRGRRRGLYGAGCRGEPHQKPAFGHRRYAARRAALARRGQPWRALSAVIEVMAARSLAEMRRLRGRSLPQALPSHRA
jgi:hypothetical protein